MNDARLEAFGRVCAQRRAALRLTQDAVRANGGPSPKRQTQIENGQPPAPSGSTLAKIDDGLRWQPGSAATVLDGGHPVALEPPPAPVYTEEDFDQHARLAAALERAGVRGVAARGARRVPEGTVFSPEAVDALIAVLDDLTADRTLHD